MKATIKTAEFQYNGTGLDALKVRSLKPKKYDDTSLPVWGVESLPRQSIDTAPPMWGIVSPGATTAESTLDHYNISSITAESFYLPGYMDQNYPLLRGLNSVPLGTGQNLPGVEFYNQALMTAYTIGAAGFNAEADYSGARSLALYAKWQRLVKSADGAASIINLVWTDIATNAVVGTKGWGLDAAASRLSLSSTVDSGPVSSNTNVPVTVYDSHIRYHIPYAVPAFVTLGAITILLGLLIALLIMRRTGLKRLRMFLESTTIGRVLFPFVQSDATSETSSSKDWVKRVGQQKVIITPDSITVDSVPLGPQSPALESEVDVEVEVEPVERPAVEETKPLAFVNTI